MKTSTASDHLVVVGGGQAAAQLIESARREGYDGSITLICEEHVLPYQRPPLSKQFLSEEHDVSWLLYRAPAFYEKYKVDVLLGCSSVGIDRSVQRVFLSDGTSVPYDRLAIATGTRARRIDAGSAAESDIYYVRSLSDVEPLRKRIANVRSVVIVGAGFIGLEVAAVFVNRGMNVDLLAQDDRLLPRLASPAVADNLEKAHRARGVRISYQSRVVEVDRDQTGRIHVHCSDGRRFEADIVLAGIGADVNGELASAAGLEYDDGIVVDEFARSSDPLIVSAGDCTNHPSGPSRRRTRLETVHNAVEQGRTAGATIAGAVMPYVQTPWVWSDQYNIRLQSVGLFQGHDHSVVRPTNQHDSFAEFYFADSQLIAATMLNQPLIFGAVRKLLNDRIPVTPEEVADPDFDITALPANRAPLSFDDPWPRAVHQASTVHWGHI